MGKFCKFCGNQLVDGQECTCSDAVRMRGGVEGGTMQSDNVTMSQPSAIGENINNNINCNGGNNAIPNYSYGNQNVYDNHGFNPQQNVALNQQYDSLNQQQNVALNQQYDSLNQQQNGTFNQQYDSPNPQQNGALNQQYDSSNPQQNVALNQQYDSPNPQQNVALNQQYDSPNPQQNVALNQQYDSPNSQQNVALNQQYDSSNSQYNAVSNQSYGASNLQYNAAPNQSYGSPNPQYGSPNQFYNNMQPRSSVSGENIFGKILKICQSYFINSVETMKNEFNEKDKTAQFLTGGIAVFLMWFLLFFIIKKTVGAFYPDGSMLILGRTLVFILVYALVRFIYMGGLYLFNRGKNPNLNYKSLAGLASISFILDAVIFFVLLLMALLELGGLFMLGIILLFISTIVGSLAIAHIATNEDFNQTYKTTFILQMIIMVFVFVFMILAKEPINQFFFGIPTFF